MKPMKPHKKCIPTKCDCVKDYIEETQKEIKRLQRIIGRFTIESGRTIEEATD